MCRALEDQYDSMVAMNKVGMEVVAMHVRQTEAKFTLLYFNINNHNLGQICKLFLNYYNQPTTGTETGFTSGEEPSLLWVPHPGASIRD